jgi:hypothetical protein
MTDAVRDSWRDDPRQWAVVAAAALLMAIILLPCVVPILPVIYFDIDPRSEVGRTPVTSLGPAGAAWLAVLGVVMAAAAMAVSVSAGGGVRWWSCTLFAIGAAFCFGYVGRGYDDRIVSAAWIGGGAVGVGALHLAQHAVARRLMVAALIAAILPMTLQAVYYVAVEHPMTVASFIEAEADFLESRGWEAGSPEHVLYVRRLTDPQATGVFGLSNVFGSIVAAATLAALAVAHGLFWRRTTRGWAAIPTALAVLGVLAVVLSSSRGAMLTLALVGGLLGFVVLARRVVMLRPAVPMAAVGVVGLALLAVFVRGWFGAPSTWEGERSLLFRYHYFQGAWAMLVDAPHRFITGVGPTGFQELYLRFKNPINPEEVTSTHNVFVDYVTMLGLGGVALSALLVMWLWQAGRAAGKPVAEAPPAQAPPLNLAELSPVAMIALVIFGTQYSLQWTMFYLDRTLVWLAGVIGFVLLATLLWRVLPRAPGWASVAGLVAAAGLLVHNQIEMTFFHLPSIAVAWGIAGLAAGAASPAAARDSVREAAREHRRHDALLTWGPAAALAGIGLLLAIVHAQPMTTHQGRLAEAARLLQQGRGAAALESLDAASRVVPTDTRVVRWQVLLRVQVAEALAAAGRRPQAERLLRQADNQLDRLDARASGPTVPRLRAALLDASARMLGDADAAEASIAASFEAIARSPYNLPAHMDLADRLWARGDRRRAADLYRRAMQIHDWNYLDPAKQLSDDERVRATIRSAG